MRARDRSFPPRSGKVALELDVAGEELTGRAHERISNVVADTGQMFCRGSGLPGRFARPCL